MEAQARPAGRWAPAELGVHPAVGGDPRGSMPAYILRPHDEKLRRVLDPEVTYSRLIVVRGDAGTGKSRAAYEAVMARLADWSLEYPPTAAALAVRLEAGIPAGTVLWLGELRRYADADGGAAALNRLDDLLDGEGHLVITTVWPEHWDAYVTAAGERRGAGDPVRAAGRLVAHLDELAFFSDPNPAYGGIIDVPARFTAEELTAAAACGDPVLAVAAAAAGPDGQVTQYLAGGPGLLRRYNGPGGDPRGQAIITAAMDAARLGYSGPLPAALLQDAAAGYLGDALGPDAALGPNAAADDQADAPTAVDAAHRRDALAWASAEFDGAVRALEPVPAATDARVADDRVADARIAEDRVAGYRIAGYLDQHGHRTRQERVGPASLWDTLTARAAETGVDDLTRVAQAARDRGLFRHAAALWTAAVSAGSADAARRLVAHLRQVNPGDAVAAARWAVGHVRLDDPWDLARLLEELRAADAGDAVQALLARDLASHTHIDYADSVAWLLEELRAVQASETIRTVLARDPASRVHLFDLQAVSRLAAELHAAGDSEAVRTLATRAVGTTADNTEYFAEILEVFRTAGADEGVRIVLARDPARRARLDDPGNVAWLLEELRAAGTDYAVQTLLARDPAGQARLDDPHDVARLLAALRAAGGGQALTSLATRAAAGASLEDPRASPS
jgi:hypothetical protein